MVDPLLRNRLDVPLTLIGGQATNLGHFCGQKLVVFFCPAGEDEAAAEIRSYETMAADFEHAGAWVVGIVGEAFHETGHALAGTHVNLGIDPDGAAFGRLTAGLPAGARPARGDGATFVVGRDSGVDHVWARTGHAARALEAARERP